METVIHHYTTIRDLDHVMKVGLETNRSIIDHTRARGLSELKNKKFPYKENEMNKYFFALSYSPDDFESIWKSKYDEPVDSFGIYSEQPTVKNKWTWFDALILYVAKRDNKGIYISTNYLDHFRKHHIARISFSLTSSDNVFVVDSKLFLDGRYSDYYKSKVTIPEYKQNYELPELIIGNKVPASRFMKVEDSPFGECDKCNDQSCCETVDEEAYKKCYSALYSY